jgi:hypothetical protein
MLAVVPLAAFFLAAAFLAEPVLFLLLPRLRIPLYVRLKRLSGKSRLLTRALRFLLSCLP